MADTGPANLIRVDDLDAAIYRVYSKSRFLEILVTGYAALVNPKKWDDPFENFFLERTHVIISEDPEERATLEEIGQSWYGQCWTQNEDTDAMWRIYSHNKDGIKVKTSVRKLFENLKKEGLPAPYLQFYIWKIKYMSDKEIDEMVGRLTFMEISYGGQNDRFADLLCIKRDSFAHESEVRLLYFDTDPPRGKDRIFRYRLDVNSIFEEVVLDPRIDDDQEAKHTGELRDAGCKLDIRRSTLYRTPHFTTPIGPTWMGNQRDRIYADHRRNRKSK